MEISLCSPMHSMHSMHPMRPVRSMRTMRSMRSSGREQKSLLALAKGAGVVPPISGHLKGKHPRQVGFVVLDQTKHWLGLGWAGLGKQG